MKRNLDESFATDTTLNGSSDSVDKVHVKFQASRRLETFLAEVATPLQNFRRLAVHQKVSLQGVLLAEDEVAGGALELVHHLRLLVLRQLQLFSCELLLGESVLDHRRELLLVQAVVGVGPERLLLLEHRLKLLRKLPLLLHHNLVALEVLLHPDVELGVVCRLGDLLPKLLLQFEICLKLCSATCWHLVLIAVGFQLNSKEKLKVKVIFPISQSKSDFSYFSK